MRLARHIRRVFGLKKTLRLSPENLLPENEGTLAYLGYPSLHQVEFFLGLQPLERWRAERTLSFPPGCCVCLKESTRFLPACASRGWLGLRGRERLLEGVPHCERHGSGDEAQLLATVDCWSAMVCRISLIGLNGEFLAEVANLNAAGDVPPPWRAFPEYSPFSSGWRQGNGEYWMGQVWHPFWTGLSQAERADYLERWAAPAEWLARLV